jgi:hypothetical protein
MSRQCCCVDAPESTSCAVWPMCQGGGCEGETPWVIPGYCSIGRPVGPTKFDGPFWPAWHNSIVARGDSAALVNLKLNAYRRKVVQEACGGKCGTVPTPSAGANCNSSGIASVTGCKRTEYIDNFSWVAAGTVYLRGGSKDQVPCIHTAPSGEKWPSIPPGPYPFILTDCTRSGLNPNNATSTTTDPAWWPGENRRIAPRFFNRIAVTASATPSTDFPQVASCGAVSVVNRCTSSTTLTNEETCIDMPITIIPGHQTTYDSSDIARCCPSGGGCECGCASNPYPCNVDSPENGGMEAAWAIDVKEPRLYDAMVAMGITSATYIGEMAKVWVTITTAGRVRFLFGALSRVSAGGVLRFQENIAIQEVQSVSKSAAGESLVVAIDFTITPKGWCKHVDACGCVHSFTENGPGTLNVSIYSRSIGCGTCGPTNFTATYILGMGEYTIPICAFPAACTGATPNCQQYPVSSACSAYHPPSGPLFTDFVGSVPVERAHAGWMKYRNKYSHFLCLNNISGQGGSACCVGSINLGGAGVTNLCGGSCTKIDPAFSAANQPCPGKLGNCLPAQPPQTVPAGCHPVQYNSGQQRLAPLPDTSLCMPCDSQFFECGPMYFAGYCGSAIYDVCDCCGTQYVASLPDIIIVDFRPTLGCTPIGTWDVYRATEATMCNRSSWEDIGYAVVS